MDMKTLDYFIQAARTQSFSQAAKDCHISQTAMSLAISKLENEIGYTLFDRDKRPMILTPAGQEFFVWAAATADSFAKIIGAKPDSDKKPLLILGAANAFDALVLSSYTKEFRRTNPSVTIMIKLFPSYNVKERLASRDVDGFFAPSFLFEGDSDVRSIPLDTFPMQIIVSSEHELAALPRVSPATLRGYTCAAVAYSSIGLADTAFPRRMEAESLMFKRIIPLEYTEEALLYAANNGAVALLPAVEAKYLPEGFAALPLEGSSKAISFAFCSLSGNDKHALADFQQFLERSKAEKPA